MDSIWLYGGDRESVFNTVFYARAGMMPNWVGRLDENTIRQLAVYVHELGGGETGKTVQAAPVEVPEAVPQEEPVVSEPEKQGQNELVPPTVPVETEVAPSEGAEVNPVKAMETLPPADNTETSGHDGE
ncbi:MAG: hypothetical protein KA099_12935 [Alphaproteobacteria bacterium]|nr:hypothetical protein [Alphaproteobacteria bacterium]